MWTHSFQLTVYLDKLVHLKLCESCEYPLEHRRIWVATSALASAMTTPVEKWPQSSFLSPGYGYMANFAGITFWKNKKATEDKEQIVGIIGANSALS